MFNAKGLPIRPVSVVFLLSEIGLAVKRWLSYVLFYGTFSLLLLSIYHRVKQSVLSMQRLEGTALVHPFFHVFMVVE